jgi:hypothetical protein
MRKYLLYIMAVIMVMFIATFVYAQDKASKAPAKEEQAQGTNAQQASNAPAPAATSAPEAAKVSELSIYGEVQNINMQANSMTVQYYDYDNDEEKSTEITLGSDSKLENAKVIGDIKKGDWVDITYTTNAGKNLAKTVSVEKEEPAQEETAPAVEE